MLRPACNSSDLGTEGFYSHVLPPCKHHCAPSHVRGRVFLGFNHLPPKISETHVPLPYTSSLHKEHDRFLNSCLHIGGGRGYAGLKLRCHSRMAVPSRPSSTNGRKKKYGGALPSILRSLESDDELERTLSSLWENLSPKEQTVILKEQRSCERLIRVWNFFKSQKDYLPNVIHYNIVLRALGRAQKWDDLRLTWIEMANNGVLPTNNTYAVLVDVYGKAGLVKEALLWIKHMKMGGIFPDEVTMNTVVRVLKEAREFDRAENFYKDWCMGQVKLDDLELDLVVGSQNGLDLADISYKQFLSTELFKIGGRAKTLASLEVEPSFRKPKLTSTYNTLIDLYGKAGRLKDAARVFAEMLGSGVAMDTITFNTMIYICGSNGHLSEAEALLKEMESRGISPDTKTYNILLSLYADSGNVDAALDSYRKIRKIGLLPDVVTYRAVIHILCERNMVEEVGFVLEDIRKSGARIDENSLPIITKMYLNAGLLTQAKDLLEGFQKDNEVSSKVRAAIMDAFAEKGLWVEAESMFLSKRKSFGIKKHVLEYNVMIKAYGKAKHYDKAFSLFKGMKNQGTWPDECTYNSLIQMLAGGDLIEDARDLLAEMQGSGFKPHCLTFSAIVACYARLGLLSDAVDMYHEMERQGVKPNEVVYGSLINGFAQIGNVEEALHYFRWMEECGIPANHIVLTSLFKVYEELGSVEGAKSVYERMRKMEGGLDIVASNNMINFYAFLGMVSEARLEFEDMREKGRFDEISFSIMMHLFKNMGMLDEVIKLADEVKQIFLQRDCDSYNKVMACYAAGGLLRECGELLLEMKSHKILPDLQTFSLIFLVLKKAGMPIEAVAQLKSAYEEGIPYALQAIISSVFLRVGLDGPARESCETFSKVKVPLHSSVYNACIYIYGALGEIDRALNVFMKMQDEHLKPDHVTYINLVACYAEAGIVEGIKRIHQLLTSGVIQPNNSLLEAVMEAYRNSNKPELAELLSKEMRFQSDPELDNNSASGSEADETYNSASGSETDETYNSASDSETDETYPDV